MKKIMILLAGITAFTTADAQYIRIGPEVGVNISNIRLNDDRSNGRRTETSTADPKAGLKIGGVIDIACSRYFSIQPGLFYSMKGYKLGEISTNGVVINKDDASRRATFNYMEMPLNFVAKFGRPRQVRLFMGAGGYLAYGVSGKVKYGPYLGSSRNTTEDLQFGTDDRNDDYRNFDAGGQIFAGILMPHGGFLRAQYQGGVANLDPANDDDYRLTNMTASITLGFLFGGHR